MKCFRTILPALLLTISFPAFAVDTVKSPFVYEGLLAFDAQGKYQFDSNAARDDEKEYNLGASYGVTSWWKTKFESIYDEKRTDDFHYKQMRWQNTFLLNSNDASIPTALFFEVVASDSVEAAHSMSGGFVFAKNIGPTTSMLNLLVRGEIGDPASDALSYLYRFQSRYHVDKHFDPGFEIHGDTNKQPAFRDQLLKIGPTAYGKFGFEDAPNFGYEIGFLFGVTRATGDGTFKWKLNYEFPQSTR